MFGIKVARQYYGQPDVYRPLLGELGEVLVFDSYAKAKAHIAKLDSSAYELAHNEYARPKYRIRRTLGGK